MKCGPYKYNAAVVQVRLQAFAFSFMESLLAADRRGERVAVAKPLRWGKR